MPDTFTPEILESARNRTKPTRKIRLPPQIASGLVEEYEPDIRQLVAEFPDIDPGLWPNFARSFRDA
jgi:hypothetical protein